MARKEEKAKVGRPKLAEPELIKESWVNIGACFVVALVMVLCGSFALSGAKISDLISLNGTSKLQGNVASIVPVRNVTVIPAQKATVIPAKKVAKRIISTDGEVTYVIPARETKTIKVSD